MKLHASGEDYLKTVFVLQKEKGTVRSVDVAERMGVSKPSVSRAVRLLCAGGFLEMREDFSLHLTELGREVGERLYERHQYFANRLADAGIDPDTAKDEACRIEHTISEDSFQKLKRQEKPSCPYIETCAFQGKTDKRMNDREYH